MAPYLYGKFLDMTVLPDIYRVRPDEVDLLTALAERTFREAWQDDNDPENFEIYCRANFTTEKMAIEMDASGSEFYFARLGDRPVAYLKINLARRPADSTAATAEKNAQVERIYVLKEYQGQRIGEQLLRFAEKRAEAAGADWLWLSVWQKSPRSVIFYQRNGYETFGVETFWVGNDPQPDWLMRKHLENGK